uniref:Alginate lyase 2 domain-containing protein n=1 Tax=Aegilops tauschii TaxID=37682 RepID=M8ARH3_AEGTA
MWVFSTDKPGSPTYPGGARTEIKINGEVYVPAGTSGAFIIQIFGAKPERQATTLMLHVYDGNLTFYHRLQSVLAHDVYDRWLRLNVVHDVGARNVTVFVDGAEKLRSSSHGAPHAEHYFKFGVYKQSHHNPSHRMESRWRNVRVFTKP